MSNNSARTASRTPFRTGRNAGPRPGRGAGGSRSGGSSGSRRGSRPGGTGHVEVIPFRPHHSWWVQLLLLGWRWLTELILLGLLAAYLVQASHAGWPIWLSVLVPVVVLAALLAWPPTRWVVQGVFWTLVTRHRLRSYFLQCGAYNRSGALPWLTLSYPTRVGARVWVWLVPGLSLADFESDTDKIAVACWARDCRVGRSKRLASLVWVDVIRQDPLTGSR